MKKRIMSLLLIFAMICSQINVSLVANAISIDDTSVFLKQPVDGDSTCVFTSCLNMFRRRAIIDGRTDWQEITHANYRNTITTDGASVYYTITNVKGMNASWVDISSKTVSEKKNYFISMLNDHPEGIVIYSGVYPVHTVLLTDYTDGTFYCAETINSYPKGRIPLTSTWLSSGSSLNDTVSRISGIWYITNKSGGGVHTHSYERNRERVHPHRVYMECSCGDIYLTGENDYEIDYEAVHPHREYIDCAVADCSERYTLTGTVAAKLMNETTYPYKEYYECPNASCEYHHSYTGKDAIPGQPYLESEQLIEANEPFIFSWSKVVNATHYNVYIDKWNGSDWSRLETVHYAEPGMVYTFPKGKYRVQLQAVNSNFYTEDGSTWLYTNDRWREYQVGSPWQGNLGENISWTLDADGLLVLEGDGATPSDPLPPWNRCSEDMNKIKQVVIGEGVTELYNIVFWGCQNLTSVTLPKSCTYIRAQAFDYCDALTDVYYGGSEADRAAMWIEGYNDDLKNATWHYTEAVKYAVSVGSVQSGVVIADKPSAAAGDTVTVSAYPNPGYELSAIYVNGVKITGLSFTMPACDVEITAEFVVSAPSEASVTVETVNGAQIRTKGKQGLRFISTIDKTSADFSRVVEYGTVLILSADITDLSELQIGATLNGHKVAKVPAEYLYSETEDTVTFTAVITNIAEKNYTRGYTARAYAILDDGTVVYSDVAPSRDVYTIAGKVLANETLSEAETAFLTRVVRYVEGIDLAINFPKPVEDAQVPLTVEVEGFTASITWNRVGGSVHTGTFQSGTDYTATIVLKSDEAFSPNDRVKINGETVSHTLSSDGKTLTVKKTYEFKDEGYSDIY